MPEPPSAESQQPAPAAEVPPRRRSRGRRWILRFAVALVTLLIVIVVTVQLVLTSDVPRRILVAQLQRALGLRVQAQSMSVSWTGQTKLRGVTLSLPLAEQALLEMPELDVQHTAVPMIAIGRGVDIKTATFRNPTLTVVQDPTGKWNIAEAAELIARAAGSKPAEEQKNTEGPKALPALTIENGRIHVRDNDGRTADVTPVIVHGQPQGPLVYRYDINVAQRLDITGDVAPQSGWQHQVQFRLTDIKEWVRDWDENFPVVRATGRWTGKMDGPRLTGRAVLEDFQAGNYSASGVASVERNPGGVFVHPANLVVKTPATLQQTVPELRLTSGELSVVGTTIAARNLMLSGAGGQGQLDGEWSWPMGTGKLQAAWRGVQLPRGITQNGQLAANVVTPWPGSPQVTANLFSGGRTATGGAWEATIDLTGSAHPPERQFGDALAAGQPTTQPAGAAIAKRFEWQIKAPSLAWRGKQEVTLRDVVAHLVSNGSRLELTDLSAREGGQLGGNGRLELTGDNPWSLSLHGRNLAVASSATPAVSFDADLSGKRDYAKLDGSLRAGELEVLAAGFYDARLPKPVDANVKIWDRPPPPELGREKPIISGSVRSELHLTGTASPLELAIGGDLFSNDLVLNGRTIGNCRVELRGRATDRLMHIETTEAQLLNGKWKLRADLPGDGPDSPLRAVVSVRELPLPEVAQLLNTEPIAGVLTGAWTFDFPSGKRSDIAMVGAADVRNIEFRTFLAERATAQFSLKNDELRISPLSMQQAGGTAVAHIDFSLANPTQWHVVASTTDWPALPERPIVGGVAQPTTLASGNAPATSKAMAMTAPEPGPANAELAATQPASAPVAFGAAGGAQARVSANASVDLLDLKARSATGRIDADTRFALAGKPIGQARSNVRLRGRSADLLELAVDAFGGKASGNGSFSLDQFYTSTGNIAWQNIEATQLEEFFPAVKGLGGKFSGSARLAPATDPRALAPLELEVSLTSDGGHFRTISIGDTTFAAFLSDNRFVVEGAKLNLAGGVVNVWARSTEHDVGGPRGSAQPVSSQADVTFQDLDLNQIWHAANPKEKPAPGKLSGEILLLGDVRSPKALGARGKVRITQSDLRGTNLIGRIYDIMNVGSSDVGPQGRGAATVALENGNLLIPSFRYFNEGTEIRAQFKISDIWNAPKSPIEGTAFGSLRPLSAIKLPFFAEADQILSVIQQGATPMRITGTLEDPKPVPIPFGDIGGQLKRMLVGDVQGETGGSAGE